MHTGARPGRPEPQPPPARSAPFSGRAQAVSEREGQMSAWAAILLLPCPQLCGFGQVT